MFRIWISPSTCNIKCAIAFLIWLKSARLFELKKKKSLYRRPVDGGPFSALALGSLSHLGACYFIAGPLFMLDSSYFQGTKINS